MKLRRWLPILLTLCLLFSLTATAAYAEDGDDDINIVDTIDIVDEPMAGDGTYALWVGSTQVTDANASSLCGGKASYDAATNTLTIQSKANITGLHEGAIIYAATEEPLTIVTPANYYFSNYSEDVAIGIYAENGLVVNGDLNVDVYDYEGGIGVKTLNGPVTVNGNADFWVQETGIYCGKGDVTITGSAVFMNDSQAELGFCPASCIYAADGGVELNTFDFSMGVAAYMIYANGPIHASGDVNIKNTGGLGGGGGGIYSATGGIVMDKDLTMQTGKVVCINAGTAAEGITVKGNATLTSSASSKAGISGMNAAGGPITVNGNLTVNCGGDPAVYALKDITVGGDAYVNSKTYSSSQHINRAIVSEEGSLSVGGKLTTYSYNSGVFAYKDITVGGDTFLSFARADDSQTVDYGMKAETGAIHVTGKLEILGKAYVSAFGGTGITADQNVSIVNAETTSVGMASNGKITFVSGKWDVNAGAVAIRAAEGVVIPSGYGVTLPAGGRVVELADGWTVTEPDKTTVAAHAVISDEISLEDGFYLIGPDWSAFDIDPANKFEENESNPGEYQLNVTLAVGDEIKVVRVENGAVTAWYPDGEHTQYTVDEAHSGSKTIYFKTSYDNAWSEFGGFFYIEANPVVTGYRISVSDYTKGLATTSLDPDALYSGEVSFTVAADAACAVGVLNADGTVTRLSCTTSDNVHSYTVTVSDADVTLVLVFKGDADLNGKVQSKDATLVKQVVVETKTLPEGTAAIQIFAADLNNDGVLQSREATMIAQVVIESKTYAW